MNIGIFIGIVASETIWPFKAVTNEAFKMKINENKIFFPSSQVQTLFA